MSLFDPLKVDTYFQGVTKITEGAYLVYGAITQCGRCFKISHFPKAGEHGEWFFGEVVDGCWVDHYSHQLPVPTVQQFAMDLARCGIQLELKQD